MPTHTNTSHRELVSDSIREIISYRPHWIVRRGNAIFLLIILLIFSSTFFISYPDTINANARIIADNPPKLITAKKEGKLVQLFVASEQPVTIGQHLGYVESTASYKEMISLRNWIDSALPSVQGGNYNIILTNPLPVFIQLGEIQPDYQLFQNQLAEAKQTLKNGYYQQKRNAIQQDLHYLAELKRNTSSQIQQLEKDKELQQAEYKAYEKLEKEKVIAPLELNQYKSKLIAKENSLTQLNTQLTSNHISVHNKIKELADLRKTTMDQQQLFYSALLDLKSKIESWIQQYVFVASENGTLIFTASFQHNQLITTGQDMFYIQPPQTKYYTEITAAQKGLGKIAEGQRLMLKVESYPSNEFGYLTGKVQHIASIPGRTDSFLIKATLPYGLKTNQNKNLYFRNNLAATAEIITAERKLIDRLLGILKQKK